MRKWLKALSHEELKSVPPLCALWAKSELIVRMTGRGSALDARGAALNSPTVYEQGFLARVELAL